MNRKILLTAVIAFALAGCAEAPPSGEFSTTGHALVAEGSATIAYQPEIKPIDDTSGADSPVDCVPDEAPSQLDQLKCTDAFTNVTGHFMNLKDLTMDGASYSLYFVDSTGNNDEEYLFDLMFDNASGMHDATTQFDEDLDGNFDAVELRVGDFVLATAGTAAGENNFGLFANATSVSASATYKGKDLTVDVGGLQAGISYTAWLFGLDENGVMDHLESFSVMDGITEYTAEQNINKYGEFHIHVSGTSLNVAIGPIA